MVVSCNSKVEGCLDIAAENFDLDADKPCDNCCLYPSMSLVLSQRWEDRNFQTSDVLYDVNQQPYYINDVKYILSAFSWEDASGSLFTIDSSTIDCNGQSIKYTRDLLQIDTRTFNYLLDTFRLFPHIQNLNFKFGWPSELSCVDETDDDLPLVFQNSNPLWDADLGQRAAVRLIIQRDTSVQVMDTLFIHTCKQLQLPYDIELPVGVDGKFDLTVDYAQWFSSVDVNDPGSFVTSILENVDGSFTRTQ